MDTQRLNDTAHAPYAAAIIHYRDADAVNRLLNSMTNWTTPPTQVFVVDNSQDFQLDSGLAIADDVVVIRMEVNVGYGPAANVSLQAAEAEYDYLLLLTQDAILAPDAAERLLKTLTSEPDIAVAVPLLKFATDDSRIFSAGGLLLRNGRTLHKWQGEPIERATELPRSPFEVAWGDGACLFLRCGPVRDIGAFDENYFLYVEEVDLQYRLQLAQKRVVLDPSALAAQSPGAYSLYYKYRNLAYFTRKHNRSLKPWPWLLALPKDSLRMILSRRPAEIYWALRGRADFYAGKMGMKPKR